MRDRHERTPKNRRRFTREEVDKIRKSHKETKISISKMSRIHGVSYPIMHNLISGKTYK